MSVLKDLWLAYEEWVVVGTALLAVYGTSCYTLLGGCRSPSSGAAQGGFGRRVDDTKKTGDGCGGFGRYKVWANAVANSLVTLISRLAASHRRPWASVDTP